MSIGAPARPVDPFEEEPISELSGIHGKHVMYTYNNGWSYEAYYKNNNTLDYQLRSGPLQGRMVKGQKVTIKRLKTAQSTKDPEGPPMYMVSWLEPTGTCVTQVLNLQDLEINTTAFFPDWVTKEPQKTVCFQNDHLDEMLSYRNIGPTYPIHHKVMSGKIHFVEDCLVKDENIVNVNASTPMQ